MRGEIDYQSYEANSRGWNGEGEYGDGDKCYVTDRNGYYEPSESTMNK